MCRTETTDGRKIGLVDTIMNMPLDVSQNTLVLDPHTLILLIDAVGVQTEKLSYIEGGTIFAS